MPEVPRPPDRAAAAGRPFPAPAVEDGAEHVFVSVGHQQMMTDAMKPLGWSLWQLIAARPMYEAGGRLWVDVTTALAAPDSRASLLELFGRGDPLLRDALEQALARAEVSAPLGGAGSASPPTAPPAAPASTLPTDPAAVSQLIERSEASLAALRTAIAAQRGEDLFELIVADQEELQRVVFDARSHQAVMAGIEAAWWLDDHLEGWLGQKGIADPLALSVPGNVTSEMGLALLDVADAVRPHPAVIAFLEGAADGELEEDLLVGLTNVEGGREAREAIERFLERFGMRGPGEIDIARPRWREDPWALVPTILNDVRTFEPGESARRFEASRHRAEATADQVLERLRALPDGARKAEETAAQIERLRTFIGYREHPKYVIVSRSYLYKQGLLAEADRLVEEGVLERREDMFFLTFDELRAVVRTRTSDPSLIERRRAEHQANEALVPPRVLTSAGEGYDGAYRGDDAPPGALVGLAVSAGVVEGRARIVSHVAEADLEAGDILVTVATDPSWSPVFLAAAGLVTEVGGHMTHGAVIAREYGLPAVVGVEEATRRIPDGTRIRLDGTNGHVVVLS